MLDTIAGNFSRYQHSEIQKWIEQGAIEGEFKTLCDIRKVIESNFGEKFFTNKEILYRIREAGGFFTNRPETDIGDYCFVDLDFLIQKLGLKFVEKNISNHQKGYVVLVEELLVLKK